MATPTIKPHTPHSRHRNNGKILWVSVVASLLIIASGLAISAYRCQLPPETGLQSATISAPKPPELAITVTVAKPDVPVIRQRIIEQINGGAGRTTSELPRLISAVTDADTAAALQMLDTSRYRLSPQYRNWPNLDTPPPQLPPGQYLLRIRIKPLRPHHALLDLSLALASFGAFCLLIASFATLTYYKSPMIDRNRITNESDAAAPKFMRQPE